MPATERVDASARGARAARPALTALALLLVLLLVLLLALLLVPHARGAALPRRAAARACTAGTDTARMTDSAYVRARYRKREALVPMRDGVRLFTAVYVPCDAGPTRRYPILLLRTPFSVAPYGPDAYPARLGPSRWTLRDGYVVVLQDVRGRYRSEGTFENVRPLREAAGGTTDEATDTHDTIAWLLAHVPEASGRVGLWGISYAGFYAALGLRAAHPALVAASPQAPVTDFFFEDLRHNGALVQGALAAYPVFGVPRPAPTTEHWWLPAYQRVAAFLDADDEYAAHLALGPLRAAGARLLPDNALWRDVLAHPTYDAFWRARAVAPALRDVRAAVLVVGGWFDAENLYGTLAAYCALRHRSPRAPVTLVMGPFGHRGWAATDAVHTTHGDLWFGDSLAARFQRDVEAPFFRHWLRRDGTPAPTGARLFDTGAHRWRAFAAWPAPGVRREAWYPRADGALALGAPARAAPRADGRPAGRTPASRAWVADPRRPVPARCRGRTVEDGALDRYMSDDQRCLVGRPDVLTFQTAPLARPLTVAGAIEAELHVSTTATDADFVVKLVDVHPADAPDHPHRPDTSVHLAGYHQLVRGEILRGRFRRSFAAPAPFRPGVRTRVVVRLPDVLHTFAPGHRVMVQIQSSWFPAFDRNPQTFVPDVAAADTAAFVRATHRLWLAPGGATRLHVPVLP